MNGRGLFFRKVAVFKRLLIVGALQRCDGNVDKAALELEVHRNALYKMLHQLEIDPARFRPAPPPRYAHLRTWPIAEVSAHGER